MKYATLCGLVLVVAGTGCAGIGINPDFGPYPASSLGSLTAGVAGFTNTGASGSQFTLAIFNTDAAAPHEVSITIDGGAATTLDIEACDAGGVLISCSANSVVVTVTDATAATVTIQPDPFNCEDVQLFIAGSGQNVTLSEEVPTDSQCTGF